MSNLFGPALRTGVPPIVKRKAYFAFHFDDIMRVNVVRNAWKIDRPESPLMRSFYDSSLWERKQIEGDDAVKRLIREGVGYTSAVCVLAGSETWLRRWVKYEIARAVIDERGLLTVHINSIRHHQTLRADPTGTNPLEGMAVGKVQETLLSPVRYYIFERNAVSDGMGGYKWSWDRYKDYTDPVKRPPWLPDCAPDYVMPLNNGSTVYDYVAHNGHKNIGGWIDAAARAAGR